MNAIRVAAVMALLGCGPKPRYDSIKPPMVDWKDEDRPIPEGASDEDAYVAAIRMMTAGGWTIRFDHQAAGVVASTWEDVEPVEMVAITEEGAYEGDRYAPGRKAVRSIVTVYRQHAVRVAVREGTLTVGIDCRSSEGWRDFRVWSSCSSERNKSYATIVGALTQATLREAARRSAQKRKPGEAPAPQPAGADR